MSNGGIRDDATSSLKFLVRVVHGIKFSVRSVSSATLGKKNVDGLYYGVLPIHIYFC